LGEFQLWLAAHPQITAVKSLPYSPTSNGKVERMNREIRKKIGALMISNNNFEWSSKLQIVCDNINAQISSTTHHTPDQLWTQGYHPGNNPNININQKLTDTSTAQEIQDHVQGRIFKNAQAMINRGHKPNVFNVGDTVRLKLTAFFYVSKRQHKSKIDKKNTICHYTPEIYRVESVMRFPQPHQPIANANIYDVRRDMYTLETTIPPIATLTSVNGQSKEFFGSDFQPVDMAHNIPSRVPDYERALTLNRIAPPFH
jgi:hypothetical protein